MNKEQCAMKLMEKLPKDIATRTQGERILNAVLSCIEDAIVEGEEVAFVGFGRFSKVKKPKKTVIGFDGKEYEVKARVVPTFKASSVFVQRCTPRRGRPPKKA